MSGGIIDALQFAIDGVSASENATSNNIANAQTPGYTDTEVSFQSSLEHALAGSAPVVATTTTTPSSAPPASNGNNVDIGAELIAAQREALQFQTESESINAQFRLIAGASGGSYT